MIDDESAVRRRVLYRIAQVIHERELAGHLPGWLVAAIDAAQPYNPDDGCGCCHGEGHEGECCPGWLHIDGERGLDGSWYRVERCDDCMVYETDCEARFAHDAVCGCAWESQEDPATTRCKACGAVGPVAPRDRE